MKKNNLFAILSFFIFSFGANAQVGIGTATPEGKFHIKGSADTSQLIIDASVSQSNSHPLIRIRNAAGVDLMHISSDGITNTFIGLNAGRVNNYVAEIKGFNNTFIGCFAGYSNTIGSENSANGYYSLYSNTNGNYNTASGNYSLSSNTTGQANTAVGWATLSRNTSGYGNSANGSGALGRNSTGSNNTANGYEALYSGTTSSNNTVNGFQALFSNNGNNNTANGYQALYSNSDGINNTANGYAALYNNSIGFNNLADGYGALFSNSTGNSNTANGVNALYFNTTGNNNTANGFEALYKNVGGSNTTNGFQALFLNTTGNNNTSGGQGALYNNTTGSGNTAFGYGADVAAGNLTNAMSLGYLTSVNASNKVRIGNGSVTVIEGSANYTVSDKRFKSDINESVPGLEFVLSLRPVNYHFLAKKFDTFLMQNQPEKIKNLEKLDYTEAEKILHTGFIAQEVDSLVKSKGYKFEAVHVPNNPTDNYSIAYSEFVVPLVKAVQEQQMLIVELKKEVELLKAEIEKIKKIN